MRYLAGFLGLLLIIAGFFAGYKLGLFLFSPETQTNADYTQTNADKFPRESASSQHESASEENFCSDEIKFINPVRNGISNGVNEDDEKFCFQKSKLTEPRGIEVDLTNNKALLYDNGKLTKIFPLAYQSPEDKWFQAPTGYYRVGVKHEKHLSSLFPVIMPYSIQFYEDFFIHGIPYYKNGENVSSEFTGGCLRFENEVAKEIYDFLKTGDQILVYKTFDDLKIKPEFHPPVDSENFWIQRRFLSPYRQTRLFGGTDALKEDYYQHAGVDFSPNADLHELNADSRGKLNVYPHTKDFGVGVYAIYDGKIAKIQLNNGTDHGLGNTIILEHRINKEKIYFLYAHLSEINPLIKEGDIINKGEIIGEVGNSGFGCQNYWRIGLDGCPSTGSGQANNNPDDIHLHFEIKKAPVLENPKGGGPYYGYTPDYPQKYGYLDPIEFLFEKN